MKGSNRMVTIELLAHNEKRSRRKMNLHEMLAKEALNSQLQLLDTLLPMTGENVLVSI